MICENQVLALTKVATDGNALVSLISYEKGDDAAEIIYQDESFQDDYKVRSDFQRFERMYDPYAFSD